MEQFGILTGEPDLSIVDRIPWMELEHAYGAAVDVPGQLRSLVDRDADVRRRTLFGFTSNLFHQGSVYSATVAAVPVFQHLLRYESFPEKSQVLELLVSFAVGFPEDVRENVDFAEFIGGPDDDSDSEERANRRECYLAVGAGVPLYELLLGDGDPRVAVSAAFTLAFFPAHAFGSCPALLAVAHDDSQHAFVRSSALIALSHLGGGAVREAFLEVLRALIDRETPNAQQPMPLLAATGVYCLLREKRQLDQPLREIAEKLAVRCIEQGVDLPPCAFYRSKQAEPDVSKLDVDELLMPDPQFPWGDLTNRIRRHVKHRPRRGGSQAGPAREPQGPDPDSFDVAPGVFDRDNVIAAARRLHAYFWGLRQSVPISEFEPFKPHAMLAWDEMLQLLDSDVSEDRWAAARVIEEFGPLEEAAVDQLIERLHRGDNNNLCSVVAKQLVSERQCAELCDRLCRRDYEESQYHGPRDDYRRIVVEHGTVAQLRRLLAEGEFRERFAAAQELSSRGEIKSGELLPLSAEALVSGDYALTMSAKWTFAKWETAQRWFLETYESLPQTQQWAIAEAMSGFGADLSERQDALFARIEAEKNQALAAKLTDVIAQLPSPERTTVDRLVALCSRESLVLVRWAVVRALGSWIGQGIDEVLSERLEAFADDSSPRVRQAAMEQLVKFDDPARRHVLVLKRLLSDEDTDTRRHAMWHLSRLGDLTVEDAHKLLSPEQPDRLSAETLLASSASREMRTALEEGGWGLSKEKRPLTNSVRRWLAEAPT